jgi:hypothetical protein
MRPRARSRRPWVEIRRKAGDAIKKMADTVKQ